jgi:thymidylate kinase/glycosyltransferase involved in cell wall biosynthesis
VRAAVLGDFYPGEAEGMAIVVQRLVSALRKIGVDVFDAGAVAQGRGARLAAAAAIPALRSSSSDLVLYVPRSGLTLASAVRAAMVRRALSVPVVILCLQADSVVRVPSILAPDAVIAPSERLASVLGDGGLASSVVELGVETAIFRSDGPSSADLWPERPGARLLHVGHAVRSRNLAVLAELAAAGYNCLFVGSPSTRADAGVLHMLHSAGVTVVRERLTDIASVYRSADAYVFPVEDVRGCIELPLSVLEARACGCRIVTTRFGGLPELLASSADVTFVDRDSFVASVAKALARDALADSRVRDWAAVATDVEHVLSQVLRRGATPRLVVLLGVDGAGKSTQVRRLAQEASVRGVPATTVWARWEPLALRPLMNAAKRAAMSRASASNSQRFARDLSLKRRIFRRAPVRRLWEWLASFDHGIQTIPRLVAALRSAQLVIADRYYYDALVDMGANFGSSPPEPHGLFRAFPTPDRVIVLDVPEEVAIGRKPDVPSLDYLKQRRPLYLELAARNGWPVVDASRTEDEVHRAVADIVWGES